MRTALSLLAAITMLSGCSESPRPIAFDRDLHKNYLIIHSGTKDAFLAVTCFTLGAETRHGADLRRDPPTERRLSKIILAQIPVLSECRGTPAMSLQVQYSAGPGVSMHGFSIEAPDQPQSGLALLTVHDALGHEVASAEWQYWRGGSPEFMAQQFVFDLTNLLIHGIEKPIS